MSKASDWINMVGTKHQIETAMPFFKAPTSNWSSHTAYVAENYAGLVMQLNQQHLKPGEALALADWIYDTFGEPEK